MGIYAICIYNFVVFLHLCILDMESLPISEKKIMLVQFIWNKKAKRTQWWEKICCKLNAYEHQKHTIEIIISEQ